MNTILVLIGVLLVISPMVIIMKNIDNIKNVSKSKDFLERTIEDLDKDIEDTLNTNIEKNFKSILDEVNISKVKDDALLNTEITNKADEEAVPLISEKKNQIIFNKNATDSDVSYDNTNKIIELYKSGLRKEEIAKMLGKGTGEIEIILRLHNMRNKI